MARADHEGGAAPLAPTAPIVDGAGRRHRSPPPRGVDGRRSPAATRVWPSPVAALARRAGYPVLAEPTSQLRAGGARPHGRLVAQLRLDLPRRPPERLAPDLVLRVGDMVTSKATRELACRQPTMPSGGRSTRAAGWNEPTWSRRPDRAGRPRAAVRLGRRRAGRDADRQCDSTPRAPPAAPPPRSSTITSTRSGTSCSSRASTVSSRGRFRPAHRSTSPPACRCATSRPSSPLAEPLRFLANRGANGIDGVVSSALRRRGRARRARRSCCSATSPSITT